MMGSAPETGTSAIGAQSTSMPSAARSAAIKPRTQSRGGKAGLPIAIVERAIGRARRVGWPMRRTEPLHPAAFLIDQHRRLAADNAAKIVDQAA